VIDFQQLFSHRLLGLALSQQWFRGSGAIFHFIDCLFWLFWIKSESACRCYLPCFTSTNLMTRKMHSWCSDDEPAPLLHQHSPRLFSFPWLVHFSWISLEPTVSPCLA
jgi:hypothetical protein